MYITAWPGGVARADNDHVVAAALGGLAAPGAVVDAALEQAVCARRLYVEIRHASASDAPVTLTSTSVSAGVQTRPDELDRSTGSGSPTQGITSPLFGPRTWPT